MHELPQDRYDTVRHLFQPLAFQPFCTAVLAGIHPGRVFVDDPDHPRTAIVTRNDAWCFLAGDPENDAFNQALNRAIWKREIGTEALPSLLFTCHPGDWHGRLEMVLAPRQPIPARRRHYVCHEMDYDWRAALPDGFSIHRMDGALLAQADLTIPNEVAETLKKWEASLGGGLYDLGFVAIHDGSGKGPAEVVSWATVDAIVDGAGDTGLVSLPQYRRRGLATVTTAAALEYALAHGVSAVHWTCAEGNRGSIRTAEKLGLERQADYTLYFLVFDEAQHLGNWAYIHLMAGRYQDAAGLLEQILTLPGERPPWIYHDAAQAWAGLGQMDRALEYLHAAADQGWTDADGTQACEEFEALHGSPEWATVLERMQGHGPEQDAGP